MTLTEMYKKAKAQEKVKSPALAFVKEVMDVTKKSEVSVRRWIAGTVVPDELTQDVLARHFGTTADKLFPTHEA